MKRRRSNHCWRNCVFKKHPELPPPGGMQFGLAFAVSRQPPLLVTGNLPLTPAAEFFRDVLRRHRSAAAWPSTRAAAPGVWAGRGCRTGARCRPRRVEKASLKRVRSKPGPPCSTITVGRSRMFLPSGTRPHPSTSKSILGPLTVSCVGCYCVAMTSRTRGVSGSAWGHCTFPGDRSRTIAGMRQRAGPHWEWPR